MGGWVPLLGVDETREEHRVPDEEDGGVVADHVPVALLGVKLDGEPTRVTGRIGRARFSADSTKTGRQGCSLAD
jgi:hypothetical protein